MICKLRREVDHDKVVGLSLGVPEVDAYLRFLKHRCRPNTLISYGYDLQVFFNIVRKPALEVTPADNFTFLQQQCEGSREQGNDASRARLSGLPRHYLNRWMPKK